jgi:hypothetical protein
MLILSTNMFNRISNHFKRFGAYLDTEKPLFPSNFSRWSIGALSAYIVCTDLSNELKDTSVVWARYPSLEPATTKRLLIGMLSTSAAVLGFYIPYGSAGIIFIKSFAEIQQKIKKTNVKV